MKTLLLVSVLLVIASASKMATMMADGHKHWETFKATYEKSYENEEDETVHKTAFLQKKHFVASHDGASFRVGLNHLSDLTPEEGAPFKKPLDADVPEAVDWRQLGLVTDVKDQGDCGCCWAFSATGALEGQHKKVTGRLVSLSEQNLMDCSWEYGNAGCNGGLMDAAFEYVKDNGGVDSAQAYPFLAMDAQCRFNESAVGADAAGFVKLPRGDEEALKIAVATVGPVSVAIDASHYSFQLYAGGVYFEPECSATNIDHAVLVVGYGSDPKEGDFWIVKNSWGQEWGEQGYVRVARNRDNHCGIASYAVFPVVQPKKETPEPSEPEKEKVIVIQVDAKTLGVVAALIVLSLLLVFFFRHQSTRRVVFAGDLGHKTGLSNPNFV
ncbi:hypothetical protein QR680_014064 [Steinernema hermaphroditum]|uniref:Cathepsin L-like n=1 Tax=Steinernema hermaphroditum TaxID=289476 RepID=A0AA39IAB4_9BILA|nr:hypothetical protein QR680_014064 [Steinernema hermaphroditum]